MNIKREQAGFTLIEMLITVVIIGIIASIAYPMYADYADRGRRSEAYGILNEVMQAQERYFIDERSYTADLTDLGYASAGALATPSGYYKLSAQACGGGIAECVLLTATPQGIQVNDGAITLNSLGQRTGNWD